MPQVAGEITVPGAEVDAELIHGTNFGVALNDDNMQDWNMTLNEVQSLRWFIVDCWSLGRQNTAKVRYAGSCGVAALGLCALCTTSICTGPPQVEGCYLYFPESMLWRNT